MMKAFLVVIGLLFLTGCKSAYEAQEFHALNDVVNDYLKRNPLQDILTPSALPDEEPTVIPSIDSLDLRVYVSDALLPVAQVKEDNEWMFTDTYKGQDSIVFYGIVNSKKFKKLGYREFDKSKLTLIKPFRQFEKSQEKVRADEVYTILNLSRVIFDERKENGIVGVEFLEGFEYGVRSGYHMAFLIKKKNDKWEYVRIK